MSDLTTTILDRYRGLETDPVVLAKHLENLSGKMEVYDQILSRQKYLAGDVRSFIYSSNHNLTLWINNIGNHPR